MLHNFIDAPVLLENLNLNVPPVNVRRVLQFSLDTQLFNEIGDILCDMCMGYTRFRKSMELGIIL